MSIAQTLWDKNLHIARSCLTHPFVQGMRDGTLDPEAFKRYVAQDAFFLNGFRDAYIRARAKTAEPEVAEKIQSFIDGVDEELKLHAGYSQQLGVDLKNVSPLPECKQYTDFLQKISTGGTLAETMAAITPCMSLYAFLGVECRKDYAAHSPYKEWIETYSGTEFLELARDVEQVLDQVARDVPEVEQAYACAMQAELEFFSAPLRQENAGA